MISENLLNLSEPRFPPLGNGNRACAQAVQGSYKTVGVAKSVNSAELDWGRAGKKCNGAWRALPKDASSIPSTHDRQFTTVCNGSSRGIQLLWLRWEPAIMHTYPYTVIQTYSHMRRFTK